MTEELIIQRLSEGWDLANRGTGWWLSAPRIAYRTTETIRVEDELVDDMEAKGVIKTELPYNTVFAMLVVKAQQ
jgi:hypothetical protein